MTETTNKCQKPHNKLLKSLQKPLKMPQQSPQKPYNSHQFYFQQIYSFTKINPNKIPISHAVNNVQLHPSSSFFSRIPNVTSATAAYQCNPTRGRSQSHSQKWKKCRKKKNSVFFTLSV